MNKKLSLIVIGLIAVIGGVTAIALSSNNMHHMSMSAGPSSSSTQQAVTANSVAIKDYIFDAMSVKVKVGTTITWDNQDSVLHTVTMDGDSSGPKSGNLSKGQKYSYTFKTAGTYNYHCEIHPSMHGKVTVTQ